MRKTFKIAISFALCFVMLLGTVAVGGEGFAEVLEAFSVKAIAASSGNCGIYGDNVIYTFDADAGLLTISGSGDMMDYDFDNSSFPYMPSIKSVVIEFGVTSIGNYAFKECTGLTSVTIPNSVTKIGKCAFYGCTGLTSITIPDSVTSIGDMAFYSTGYYQKGSNWNDGVLYIGSHLIKANSSIISNSYSINNGTKVIADAAFYYCRHLYSITIPDSVTTIGEWAFGCCEDLAKINISNSVMSIGNNAFTNSKYFDNKSNWENEVLYIGNHLIKANSDAISGSYSINSGTITIANYAFSSCKGLKNITIPNSVKSIGKSAFSGCIGLTSITIPNSVTSIGNWVFCYCTGLTSIAIPDSVTSIGDYAFEECTSLSSIAIPNSVMSIGRSAFSICKKLTSITIPNGVTSIGSYTFNNCTNLTRIIIPNSIKSIDSYAFKDCSSLKDVYYDGSSKSNIDIDDSNSWLLSANWHCNTTDSEDNPSQNPDPVAGITETDIIKGNASNNQKTYEYKTAVTFNANVPEGGSVQWYVDDKSAGTNASLTVPAATKSYTVKVVVTDKNGGKTADTENVTIKSSFFDKLIYFFKHLFNPNAYIINQQ